MNEVRIPAHLKLQSSTNSSAGEYAPVMVDLDDEGREKGLISL